MQRPHRRLSQDSPRFVLPVPAGPVDVRLIDHGQDGAWRFLLNGDSTLHVDFLDPLLCSVPGTQPLLRRIDPGFIPTPRLRISINGTVNELACADARVLQRHYSRPHHQEHAYTPRPDPWQLAYHEARVRQARRLLAGVSGRICDVGSGFSLPRMAGVATPALELWACDRDEEAVHHLVAQGVHAAVGPADDPPFPPGSFDAVYAGEIVEHVVDPHRALRAWVALLRPGGRLVVTTPNRSHLLARVRGYELIENPEHLFEWNATELRGAVAGAGADVVTLEGLLLPIPVYVPGTGWRDLSGALARRLPLPPRLLRFGVGLGRHLPALAFDLAVVARRPS